MHALCEGGLNRLAVCSVLPGYEDTTACPQRSTSTLATPGVGTAAQPRPYRPGYLTPNDGNPSPALLTTFSGFDPFNYYLLDPTFNVRPCAACITSGSHAGFAHVITRFAMCPLCSSGERKALLGFQ